MYDPDPYPCDITSHADLHNLLERSTINAGPRTVEIAAYMLHTGGIPMEIRDGLIAWDATQHGNALCVKLRLTSHDEGWSSDLRTLHCTLERMLEENEESSVERMYELGDTIGDDEFWKFWGETEDEAEREAQRKAEKAAKEWRIENGDGGWHEA
jgi:hypothetical protein